MSYLAEKYKCTGCMVCVAACPQECIEVREDELGFKYPVVLEEKCIGCHKCERVCPESKKLEVTSASYAVFNKKNTKEIKCSSSGLFGELAKIVICNGGVVYGAAMVSPYRVEHVCVDRIEQLDMICCSKYVQSYVSKDIYIEINQIVQSRIVLFAGTPCQVAAAKAFVGSNQNLITVDIICHGVPAPRVWKDYLTSISEGSIPNSVCFRDKRNEECYGLSVKYLDGKEFYEKVTDNLYLQGFIQNLYLRSSCTKCSFKGSKRASDITLGDLWRCEKIDKKFVNKSNGSWVLINNSVGNELFDAVKNLFEINKIEIKDAEKFNNAYSSSAIMHKNNKKFIRNYCSEYIENMMQDNLKEKILQKCIKKIKRILKRILQ